MNIEKEVLDLIVGYFNFNEKTPTAATRFVADLGFDSLDSVEFVMALEDEFAIEISDDDAEKCESVADAVALIGRLLEEQS